MVCGMKALLSKIKLKNILSFNQEGIDIELQNLNVLIGANGSGKSNFIEALSLLQAAPNNLASGMRERGGIATWLHKTQQESDTIPIASIEVLTGVTSSHRDNVPINHRIDFTQSEYRFELIDEVIEDKTSIFNNEELVCSYYQFHSPNHCPMITIMDKSGNRGLQELSVSAEESILSQRKDPDLYPEITQLSKEYEQIRIYREWTFGRYSKTREPQRADLRNDFLEENCQNLALVLNKIQNNPPIKKKILEYLKILYPRFSDYSTAINAGSAQIFFIENNISIPATRLSDGTLRFLFLLAALYNPFAGNLICIEEPELGLHPDILPTIAEILKEVSLAKQLIVTTHSDILIDALSDTPESVIVCENTKGYTTLKRLNENELREWLEEYSLGQLWTRGEIGGNRFG